MPTPNSASFFADIIASESTYDAEQAKYKHDKAKKLAEWAEHPWAWLSGTDLDGRPLIWTKDEKDEERPIKSFPAGRGHPESEYLERLVELLVHEKFLAIDKPRQMIVSTTCCLVMDHHCRFKMARRWVLSKHKEDLAAQLLNDKIRFAHEQLPEWVQKALPLKDKPWTKLEYPKTFGLIHAAAQNVAEGLARGITATGFFADEAPFQDSLGSIVGSVLPMCDRVWAVGTPPEALGSPGAREWIDNILAKRFEAVPDHC